MSRRAKAMLKASTGGTDGDAALPTVRDKRKRPCASNKSNISNKTTPRAGASARRKNGSHAASTPLKGSLPTGVKAQKKSKQAENEAQALVTKAIVECIEGENDGANALGGESCSSPPVKVKEESEPLLCVMFEALDQGIMMHKMRQQKCTFSLLQKVVESACRRDFTLRHLARISTVMPEAYTVTQVTVPVKAWSSASAGINAQPVRKRGGITRETLVVDFGGRELGAKKLKVTGQELLKRRHEFAQLYEKAMAQHCRCPPVAAMKTSASVLQGQPDCACIPESPLSEPLPAAQFTKDASTMNAQLRDEQEQNSPPTISGEVALESLESVPATSAASTEEEKEKVGGLEGLRKRLLVREAEAAKLESRTPQELDLAHQRASELPRVADAVYSYFVGKHTSSVYLSTIATELSRTWRHPVKVSDMRDRLGVLAKIVPEWCSIKGNDTGTIEKKRTGKTNGRAALRGKE
ncbi:unnamed protein product, partial [Chrysoparadoxa australica]